MMSRKIQSMTVAAPGITFVEGPASNWVVLTGEGGVTLIDAGYPKDLPLVEESIRAAGGDPRDLTGIFITHGHSDHIGSVAALVERYAPRVVGHPDELGNIRRDELHQISIGDVLPRLWDPLVAAWVVHAISSGGLAEVGVRIVGGMDVDAALPILSHRVMAIPTAGHTPGHAAYFFPAEAVIVTGDALITAHATSRRSGPQLLSDMWHSDPAQAQAALLNLERLDAVTILPGHGPMLRQPVRPAVSAARAALPRR